MGGELSVRVAGIHSYSDFIVPIVPIIILVPVIKTHCAWNDYFRLRDFHFFRWISYGKENGE